jgi:3,4-dihydroxy 2-butanone 4-phosphate synthase
VSLEEAIENLRKGGFVLIRDSVTRENEVDLVAAAESVGPEHVATMRVDGGGLICVALHPIIAGNFGLPYLTEVYEEARRRFRVLTLTRPDDILYDERSAFSLSVNHRKTFTGITDTDRALTIRELGKLGEKALQGSIVREFGETFRSPGHVPLLRAAEKLLLERRGHTELSVALADLAGVVPATVICEMLDARTKLALSERKARDYAEGRGLTFLEGSEIVDAWSEARA